MSNLNLVKFAGDLDKYPEILQSLVNSEIDALWKADPIFLAIKARENPNIPLPYFVDFIKKAQLTGADPRLNQVYLVPVRKKDPKTGNYIDAANVVFAYQFFMDKASRTKNLDWFKVVSKIEKYFDPTTGKEKDTLVSTCWVKRKTMEEVIEYKARYPEFAQNTYTWKSKPYLMLEKCAIANAFRWAFPEALTGIYIAEEMTGGPIVDQGQKKTVENINPPKIEKTKIDPPKTENTFKNSMDEIGKKIWIAIKILTNNLENKEEYNKILKNLGLENISDIKTRDYEQRESYLNFLLEEIDKNEKVD